MKLVISTSTKPTELKLNVSVTCMQKIMHKMQPVGQIGITLVTIPYLLTFFFFFFVHNVGVLRILVHLFTIELMTI